MSNPGMRINYKIDRPEPETVEKFRGSAVANIADVMGRLFAMNNNIRPMGKSMSICGPAFTVKAAIADNMMFHKALTMARPGDVVVVNACGDTNHSVCGDVMYRLAEKKGIAGFVVDGSIRDTDYLRENDFPVYAAGVTARGPYKNGPGEINTDIACGGQVIHPGDLIVGDADGIVVIRKEDLDVVYEKLLAIRQNEVNLTRLIENDEWDSCAIVKAVEEKIAQQGYEIIK
ncbi:RraA family protein [Anaerolentibacter hominis]|uniref:RraA family protein n=1 Tax=Anaerolentibacter hominis TaxID=3079009 RepID=UPI0031B858BB